MAVINHRPDFYCNAFGSGEPALRIRHGDTVSTSTVDAHGYDGRMDAVAGGVNPVTGPFFVEGAEEGDTLAVRLDRLSPNRGSGWTRMSLAPNVVDPDFVPRLGERDYLEWAIDLSGWTATLNDPKASDLRLTLPLAPMLGCIGVAPEGGQIITTMTSGPYGGNMDYTGCREGATLCFPVFAKGALLYVGDGHAVQGDGEIIGTGLETSFDVQFTVSVLKAKSIRWPRGEDRFRIFTLGNARPLDQALQHATTEMFIRLNEDYGFDSLASSLLLGCAVKYEIGNVFDPAYTVACILPKDRLKRGK